jgi:hypothetical protein
LEESLSTGASRNTGFTHKLIAQALQFRSDLGDKAVDQAAIVEHARVALEQLPEDEIDWRAEVSSILKRHPAGMSLANPAGDPGLGDTLAHLRIVNQDDPAAACALAERIWAAGLEGEDDRTEVLRLYLGTCWELIAGQNLFPSRVAALLTSRAKKFEQARRRLEARLSSDGEPSDSYRELLGLVARAPEYDAEASALELIERAFAGEVDATRKDIARSAYAFMSLNHGATAWQSKAYQEAAFRYFAAAEQCVYASLPRSAREALARGIDAVAAAGFPSQPALFSALHSAAIAVERTGEGGQVARTLRACWDRLIGGAFAHASPSAGIIFAMMQLAKGAEFGRLLGDPRPLAVADFPELGATLEAIVRTGALPGGRAPVGDDTEEFILNAIDDGVSFEGRTPQERSANLQRKFDQRLRHHLHERTSGQQLFSCWTRLRRCWTKRASCSPSTLAAPATRNQSPGSSRSRETCVSASR